MSASEGIELVGKWVTDPGDSASLRRYGQVTLEFTDDGWLIYTVAVEGREQEILLTYRVQEGLLITDQCFATEEARTRYSLTPDGKLTLLHGHHRSRYLRAGPPPR